MSDDELVRAIDELTRTLQELQGELQSERRGPRLRPPTPAEVLRAADEVAIPAVIAILEANVRALQATQQGVRLLRRERDVRNRVDATTDRGRTSAGELRRSTLEQLDVALGALQRGVGGEDPRTRELVEDARSLRAELADRLDDISGVEDRRTDPEPEGGVSGEVFSIEIEDGERDDADPPESSTDPQVDVDAELETLRERYGTDDDGEPEQESAEDAESDVAGSDAAESAEAESDTAESAEAESEVDENNAGGSDAAAASDDPKTGVKTESGTDAGEKGGPVDPDEDSSETGDDESAEPSA